MFTVHSLYSLPIVNSYICQVTKIRGKDAVAYMLEVKEYLKRAHLDHLLLCVSPPRVRVAQTAGTAVLASPFLLKDFLAVQINDKSCYTDLQ